MKIDYDSPINLIYHTHDLIEKVNNETDKEIYRAICKMGIDIDKGKLLSAIRQDKQRYENAYQNGYYDAKDEIILCKNCEHRKFFKGISSCEEHFIKTKDDFYCADAKRADPCENCSTRKYYATAWDKHFYGEDCPFKCKLYVLYIKEKKKQSN